MLSLLTHRLATIVASAKEPVLDIKRSREAFRDIDALGLSCQNLHPWTVCQPATPMCAHFTSQFTHRKDVIESSAIFDVIHRFMPCEIMRLLSALLQHESKDLPHETRKTSQPSRTEDLILQCAKRCIELRPSLSFDEVTTLIGQFGELGAFSSRFGEQLLDEFLHRSWYLIEEATATDVQRMLTHVFSYVHKLPPDFVQSYLESVAERVVDIIGVTHERSDKKELQGVVLNANDIIRHFHMHGWRHVQLEEACHFITQKQACGELSVVGK